VETVRSNEAAQCVCKQGRLWMRFAGGVTLFLLCAETRVSITGLELSGQGVANVVNGILSSLASQPPSLLSKEGAEVAQVLQFFFVETEEQTGHRLG